MPSVPYIPVEERDPWSRRYYYLIRQDEHEVTDAAIRRTRHAYYGMISYVDDKVGELLRTLDALGMADNTVVVFTADHGDMMGERGMWYEFNPYEWSARVPLVVRAPYIGRSPASVARCSTRRKPEPLRAAAKSSFSALCSTTRLSQTSTEPGDQRKRKVNSGRVACPWR